MDGKAGRDGLQLCVAGMIGLEVRIDEILTRTPPAVDEYLEAPTVVGRLRTLLRGQRQALQVRLQDLTRDDGRDIGSALSAAFEAAPAVPPSEDAGTTVAWLRDVATACEQAAFGYAVLHAAAHRFYDVPTADFADQHRRNYLEAGRALHRAVGGGNYDNPVLLVRGRAMLPRARDAATRARKIGVRLVAGTDTDYGPRSTRRIPDELAVAVNRLSH